MSLSHSSVHSEQESLAQSAVLTGDDARADLIGYQNGLREGWASVIHENHNSWVAWGKLAARHLQLEGKPILFVCLGVFGCLLLNARWNCLVPWVSKAVSCICNSDRELLNHIRTWVRQEHHPTESWTFSISDKSFLVTREQERSRTDLENFQQWKLIIIISFRIRVYDVPEIRFLRVYQPNSIQF